MGGPCEQLLDQHFKQQIREFGPIFVSMACKSDQSIISYWIQIFEAAPRAQKWARNCMMLLIYGHLEEFGYLQIPFTDMRNCGKDLNEILDGYQGLVAKAPRLDPGIQKFQGVLCSSHSVADNQVAILKKSSKKCSAVSLKRSSGRNVLPKVPKTVTFQDCEQKSLTSVLTEISLQTKFPHDSLDIEANEQLVKIESRIIMELKELYKVEPPQPFPGRPENYNSRAPLTTRTATRGSSSSTNKTSETDDSKLRNYYEKVKENRPNNYQREALQPEEGIYALNSSNNVKFKDLVELMAKYNKYIMLDRKRLAGGAERTDKSNQPKLKRAEKRLAQSEKTLELLKKNWMLRRECLRYYTKDGVLRPQVKQLKEEHNWATGLLIGGYRALHRYARCRGLVRGQGKFEQLNGCKHGWRCYRRLLLANCVPYCRSKLMHTKLDSKRQSILMRMSHILRMKQVFSHLGELEYDPKELLLLLEAFERKYLKLANELHFVMFKIVK